MLTTTFLFIFPSYYSHKSGKGSTTTDFRNRKLRCDQIEACRDSREESFANQRNHRTRKEGLRDMSNYQLSYRRAQNEKKSIMSFKNLLLKTKCIAKTLFQTKKENQFYTI